MPMPYYSKTQYSSCGSFIEAKHAARPRATRDLFGLWLSRIPCHDPRLSVGSPEVSRTVCRVGFLQHPRFIRIRCDAANDDPPCPSLMTKRTQWVIRPCQLHTSTVKKSLAAIAFQCALRNTDHEMRLPTYYLSHGGGDERSFHILLPCATH